MSESIGLEFFKAMIILSLIFCIIGGVGYLFEDHNPVNTTEKITDKRILSYKYDVRYCVFTDSYKFEMTLKDYNNVNIGDEVVIAGYNNTSGGTAYFGNGSIVYSVFGD